MVNFVELALLLLGFSAGMILAGYWLAAGLTRISSGERLAVAALSGLAIMLWNVSVVNFFQPLAGVCLWVCLWPVALSVMHPRTRKCIGRDVGTVFFSRRGAVVAGLGALFLAGLLWPLLTHSALVFYDGTSNHDSFFWVSASEFLKRHSYMEIPATNATHPLMNSVSAITGWRPAWGRMGAEGLLALASGLTGVSTIKIYLCATAVLFIPWIAAVFLVLKTFLFDRLSSLTLAALVLLQPIFIFFHGNSNLPNLIGILTGAAVVVATERSLRERPGRIAWLALLAFAFHGLICSYPEMVPFIVLPCALLWLRGWAMKKKRAIWQPALGVAVAFVAALALNPASTVRAWHGFIISFDTARADHSWANIFATLSPAEYVPALTTLALGACKDLGPVPGAMLSLGLLLGAVFALRQARDPFGALATLAGPAALIAYTLGTDFNYGWQKSVQFGGVFCAAFFPVALIEVLAFTPSDSASRRRFVRVAGGVVLTFFVYATVLNALNGYTWSERKPITQDWFNLRNYARKNLPDLPVLIEGASFRMPFYHSMWATYFLPDNSLYFGARGEPGGGYLNQSVINEKSGRVPKSPEPAVLVGRDWADSFDANAPRLFLGDTVALLAKANRVVAWNGLYPDNGVPFFAAGRITLDLRPYTHSRLHLILIPRDAHKPNVLHWTVINWTEGEKNVTTDVAGAAPWHFVIPLVPGQLNRLEFTSSSNVTPDDGDPLDFAVRELRIETLP